MVNTNVVEDRSVGTAPLFRGTPITRWLARHPRAGLPLLLLALLALWGLAGGAAPPPELLP